MLKTLSLKNFILVEDAKIDFESNFSAISGETGSGKTAIIDALKLILGKRCDSSKVRKGCDKAIIQALFHTDTLQPILLNAGIEAENELIITREIQATGKSRCFLNSQLVPLQFLQKLAPHLIDFVDQHAHSEMRNLEKQRDLLDLFGNHAPLLKNFQKTWELEKNLQKKLSALKSKVTDERKFLLSHQIKELEQAAIEENEEETLFEEYTRLVNSQELFSKTDEVYAGIEAITPQLSHHLNLIDSILKYDKNLNSPQKMLFEAHLQLKEVAYELRSLKSNANLNPNRLNFLEERLKLISTLKKKYGDKLSEALEKLLDESDILENSAAKIEELSSKHEEARNHTNKASEALTLARGTSARSLEKKLSEALKDLNIPHAEVQIQIEKVPRSQAGEDLPNFFLRANLGEKSASVRESTSGGELARLLFSLKIILAEKNPTTTMVFDEIDANVGGETASIIGKKLQELGKHRQVICITHFPQVAKHADHHIRVYKQEDNHRTLTLIELLNKKTKEKELIRMLGGQ